MLSGSGEAAAALTGLRAPGAAAPRLALAGPKPPLVSTGCTGRPPGTSLTRQPAAVKPCGRRACPVRAEPPRRHRGCSGPALRPRHGRGGGAEASGVLQPCFPHRPSSDLRALTRLSSVWGSLAMS